MPAAQTLEARGRGESVLGRFDGLRTARLGGFGLLFYGPLMHHWYGALNAALPVDRAAPLAAKLPPFVAKARARRAHACLIETAQRSGAPAQPPRPR